MSGLEQQRPRRRAGLHLLISVVAAGVLLYLFWPLLGEIQAALGLLTELHWGWLVLALALQGGGYASLTALNAGLLRPFPGHIRFGRLMAVLTAMAFVEVALPSAGASGVVLRARLLGDRGYTVEASTLTLILETFFETSVKLATSLLGLWYLLRQGDLGPGELLLLGLGVLALLALAGWLRSLSRRPEQWQRLAERGVAAWNWLAVRLRRPPLAPAEAADRIEQAHHGLAALQQTGVWRPWLAAAGHVVLDVTSLGACFAALGYAAPLATLLTGYGAMLLLSGFAALPGGLGLAEASLTVLFVRLGVPGPAAIAGSLLYRLISFWLLRAIGLLNWQWLEAQHARPTTDPTSFRPTRSQL